MDLAFLILIAFGLAPLAAWLGGRSSALVALVPLALALCFLAIVPPVASGAAVSTAYSWIPSLGVAAAFRADGLSLLFALLITGIGTAVFLYASLYLKKYPRLPRFYAVLTLFMAAMLGAVLADDLLLLVVFWELTSLTSFLLIGFSPEQAMSRRAAQQGLLVTVGGGLAMLAGVILLGQITGSYSLSGLIARKDEVAAHALAPTIICLLAAGAFAKSAQSPLHPWLANAMVAPTPVSAFLHSATMVKLGVYLLARLSPVFEGHATWVLLLTGFGGLTMLVGAVLALRESDLKRVLAYSTIISLGTLVLMIGIPGELSAMAIVTFLVVHALYKACLFLVAGIIDQQTGTRDSSALGGLHQAMPLTALAALAGSLSMAGLPPFIGFAAKELVYETGLAASASGLVVGIALLANIAMVVVACILSLRCFAGPRVETPKTPQDPGLAMLAGPLVLAALGLVFGLAPWLVSDALILPAAAAIAGRPIDYTLSLWHGFTPMLLLSVVTLALGIAVFRNGTGIRLRLAMVEAIPRWGPDRGYDRLMQGLQQLAAWQTRMIQSGSLRTYTGYTVAVAALAGLSALISQGGMAWPDFAASRQPELVIAALLAASTFAVLRARNFVAGIAAAGLVGFAVALLFLFQGAPDLAFTQFSVEALSIVILLAIIGRLPFRDSDYRRRGERLRDGAIALAAGTMATLVMLSVLAQPFDARLSDFFRAESLPQAHGRNLVNVIIVDFRALDTLGEITVLGLAAIAAAAVIAGLRRATAGDAR
jgi:multicomponent Na+:H+ antiporter subunit A